MMLEVVVLAILAIWDYTGRFRHLHMGVEGDGQ